MCIYAMPMLALYMIGIAVAWWVHPSRRKSQGGREVILRSFRNRVAGADAGCPILAESLFLRQGWETTNLDLRSIDDEIVYGASPLLPARRAGPAALQRHQSAGVCARIRRHRPALAHQPGPSKAEAFLRDHFQHDQLEEDTFTAIDAHRPGRHAQLHRALSRQKGRRDRAGHALRDQLLLKNINYVGANDGGSTTGLLMAIADQLRAQTRAARSWTATRSGWSSLTAKRRFRPGPTPTRPTAAATWPPSGAATARWAGSSPLFWPT